MKSNKKWALFHIPKSTVVFVDDTKEFITKVLNENNIYFQNGVYFYKFKTPINKDMEDDDDCAECEHEILLNSVEFEIIRIEVLQSTDTVFSYKVIKDASLGKK
jgi:hypothetical protein